MKLRGTWTLALLAAGMTIGACATSETGDDDDDMTSTGTTTGTMTGTPGGAVTGTTTGTPGGAATGTTTGTTTGSGTGGGGATGGQGGFGGDLGGAGGAGAATGGGGGAPGGSGGSGGGTGGAGGGTGGAGGGGASALSCFSPSDCTSTATDICDVETETCQPIECDPSTSQPAGCTGTDPYCLEQHSLSGLGACYELCDPFDASCPSGYECVTNNVGQDLGVCHQPGAGTTGAACNPAPNPADEWMTSSGCALGNVCMDAGGGNYECFQTCDFFGAPTCNGATVCYPWGYCDTPVGGTQDSVAVNATCNGAGGELCGLTGGRDGYAGRCEDLDDGLNMVCHAFCDSAGNYSCLSPTDTCYDVFSDPWSGHVGLCAQPPGSGCTQASDCTDPATEICDVDTETCQTSECDPAQAQPGGCAGTDPICMEQSASSGIGACYEQCDPYDVACPGSLECRNNTYGQDWGLCLNAGTGTTGDTCSPMTGTEWGTTTGCVTGNICMGNTCWEVCDFWSSPTCTGSTVCHLFGFCDAPTGGGYDAVDVGDACSGASGGEDCGLVSGHDGYQGACNDLGDGLDMICRPYCTTADNPCVNAPFNGVCYDVFPAPLEGQVGTCAM